jgi:hypothetical protein
LVFGIFHWRELCSVWLSFSNSFRTHALFFFF